MFTSTEGELPRIGNEALCCLCGQCLAACPSGAVSPSLLHRWAHSLGLGTCWSGYLSKAASGFKVPSFTAPREFRSALPP